jgi:hypothetical protein
MLINGLGFGEEIVKGYVPSVVTSAAMPRSGPRQKALGSSHAAIPAGAPRKLLGYLGQGAARPG